jgi:hypothetical protein
VKKLVLVHLPSNGDVEKIHAVAAKKFGGKVVVRRISRGSDFEFCMTLLSQATRRAKLPQRS